MTSPKNRDETDGKTTVFFSYSRVDQKDALPIIKAIEAAGYRLWWDGMIGGGTSFLETTEDALESAQAVVVLWSKTSVKSHWVRDEAGSGKARERLLPISLDGTLPPLGFRQVQMIDFSQWNNDVDAACFQDLKRGLALFHGNDAPQFAATATALSKPKFKPLSRRAMFLGAGGLVIGAGAGLAITSYRGEEESSVKAVSNSLAVMPFTSYLADDTADNIIAGLVSEIRSQLAKNRSLKVLAKSSSVAAVKDGLTVQAMSKSLGIAHVVEGSVNAFGETVKLSVTLTEAATGFSVWSQSYDSSLEELLLVKQSVTQGVVRTLSDILNADIASDERGETQSPAAFDAYLKGRALYTAFESIETLKSALNYFNLAIDIDPNFGLAFVSKAQLLLSLGNNSADSDVAQAYVTAALETAQRAVDIAPQLADTHSVLGYIRMGALDIDGAKAPYERAYELNTGNTAVFARYAIYKMVIGHHDKALIAINQALEIDPLNETMYNTAGLIHYAARRYEDAINHYERVLKMAPNFFNANAQIGLSLIRLGRVKEGIARCAVEQNAMERLPCLAIGNMILGNQEAAQAAMDDLMATFGDAGAYQQLQVLAEWEQTDAAMAMLEKAIDLKDSGLTLAQFDPALDSLRGRQDFKELLAQIGL